jgi:hypothetical protein
MRLRHAAALTLAGWYLMMPPHGSVKMITEADRVVTWAWVRPVPLAGWSIVQGFDRADECTKQKGQLLQSAIAASNSNDKVFSKRVAEMFAAQCIATDDPRLKGN